MNKFVYLNDITPFGYASNEHLWNRSGTILKLGGKRRSFILTHSKQNFLCLLFVEFPQPPLCATPCLISQGYASCELHRCAVRSAVWQSLEWLHFIGRIVHGSWRCRQGSRLFIYTAISQTDDLSLGFQALILREAFVGTGLL